MFEKFRIYLRALEIEDYKITYKWRQDPDIIYGFSSKMVYVSSENEKKWIEDAINDFSKVSLGICTKTDDKLIGLVFLNDIDLHTRTGHCPILIGDKSYWSQGLATEARILILFHAFFDRGLNRIWARVLTDNIGSIKILEKTGYKKEGTLKQSMFKKGKFVDEYLYAVLKDDFLKILEEYYEN